MAKKSIDTATGRRVDVPGIDTVLPPSAPDGGGVDRDPHGFFQRQEAVRETVFRRHKIAPDRSLRISGVPKLVEGQRTEPVLLPSQT